MTIILLALKNMRKQHKFDGIKSNPVTVFSNNLLTAHITVYLSIVFLRRSVKLRSKGELTECERILQSEETWFVSQ